jgi:hypothetical protein
MPRYVLSFRVDPADTERQDECRGELYRHRYLNIGENASGDYFALDLDAARSERDGAVVSFRHETLQIQRQWESVAAFVESILSE